MSEQALLRCRAVAFVDAESFPPVVEVAFIDADGREWRIRDKDVIFQWPTEPVPGSPLPKSASIRVRVVAHGEVVEVSTDPQGVESIEGKSQFLVLRGQLDFFAQ